MQRYLMQRYLHECCCQPCIYTMLASPPPPVLLVHGLASGCVHSPLLSINVWCSGTCVMAWPPNQNESRLRRTLSQPKMPLWHSRSERSRSERS
jgi:hypothetical protein